MGVCHETISKNGLDLITKRVFLFSDSIIHLKNERSDNKATSFKSTSPAKEHSINVSGPITAADSEKLILLLKRQFSNNSEQRKSTKQISDSKNTKFKGDITHIFIKYNLFY